MIYKYKYGNQQEKEVIIQQNNEKFLIEQQEITEGNFLIFTDEKPQELFLEELERRVKTTESQINALDTKSEMIEGAVVELATLVLE